MLHTHWVLGPGPSEISDSLPGILNGIFFNTPQENFGEFSGYKLCITDYTGCKLLKCGHIIYHFKALDLEISNI